MAGNAKQDKLVFSVEEAAKVLGIGRNLAYEGVRAGDIPSIKIGGRTLVPKSALERMLSGGSSVQVH